VGVGVVAKFEAQAAAAARRGARVFRPDDGNLAIVEGVADWVGATLRRPFDGLPFAHPGGVDVVYDTIGSPGTLEVGVRVACPRGRIVVTGVATPGRFEWTPWYFKELTIVGSNAFGIEEYDGIRQHAIRHYLDMVGVGKVDVADVLTHTFTLDRWHDAFLALADQAGSGAIKVAIDHR
jgi:threonine dehydrogenase-like Zn-dependent dehydrogenase